MTRPTRSEAALIEPVRLAPMIDQTPASATINRGTCIRSGPETMAKRLADALSTLPGTVEPIDTASLVPKARRSAILLHRIDRGIDRS